VFQAELQQRRIDMPNTPRVAAAALTCTLLAFSTGCGPAVMEDPTFGAQPAPAMAGQADMWATTGAAFQGGVTGAEFALGRTEDPAVRAYAQRLVDDYGAAGQRFTGLMTRHNIDVTPGEGAQRFEQTQRQTAEALGNYHGADFDRRWIDHQIATHEWMLNAIDNNYLPAARGRADLEAELRTTRGTIEQHLAEARRIRTGWQQQPQQQEQQPPQQQQQ
jgi:putative membrane protein